MLNKRGIESPPSPIRLWPAPALMKHVISTLPNRVHGIDLKSTHLSWSFSYQLISSLWRALGALILSSPWEPLDIFQAVSETEKQHTYELSWCLEINRWRQPLYRRIQVQSPHHRCQRPVTFDLFQFPDPCFYVSSVRYNSRRFPVKGAVSSTPLFYIQGHDCSK